MEGAEAADAPADDVDGGEGSPGMFIREVLLEGSGGSDDTLLDLADKVGCVRVCVCVCASLCVDGCQVAVGWGGLTGADRVGFTIREGTTGCVGVGG
jgi:hypothetical protein